MSGPKGYTVTLSPEQIRRNELERRRRSWMTLASQVELMHAQLATLGVDVNLTVDLTTAGYPPSRVSNPGERYLDRVDDFSRSVSTVLARARRAIADRAAADVRRNLAGLLEASDTIRVSNLDEVAVRHPVRVVEAGVAQPSTPKSEVLLDLLARTGSSREELASRIEAAVRADVGERGWLAIARDVAAAARSESDRVERDVLADELRALVARIDDPKVTADLVARIEAAPTRSILESRRPEILDAITAQELHAQRRYVLAQAVEVWRELGYEVAANLEETALDGSANLLYRDGWPDHALQVRFAGGRDQLATNVVSFGATSPDRDREIEEDHCSDAPEFTRRLADRGVRAALTRAKPAGVLPVQKLSAEATRGTARRAQARRTFG